MKFGLDDKVIFMLNNVFKDFPEVEEAVLYGSRAIGNYRNGSDIDLTFKGENLNQSLINKILIKIDDLYLPYKLDFSVFKHISNPSLVNHIERVGQLFYKKM